MKTTAKRKAYFKRWYRKNREKKRAYDNAWRKRNLIQYRALVLKHQVKLRYGISMEEYRKYLHGKCCAICCSSADIVLDHCHKTKKVRGVLCRKCNAGIGLLKDDLKLLRRAVKYLEAA